MAKAIEKTGKIESPFASMLMGIPAKKLDRFVLRGCGDCRNGVAVLHVFSKADDRTVLVCPGRLTDRGCCPPAFGTFEGLTLCSADNLTPIRLDRPA